jgi:hypothetical protein
MPLDILWCGEAEDEDYRASPASEVDGEKHHVVHGEERRAHTLEVEAFALGNHMIYAPILFAAAVGESTTV